MNSSSKHISVCICTFRRAAMLKRLLGEIARQQTDGRFTYSIVVVDNDEQQSARPVVAEFTAKFPVETVYCFEPRKNIALARNTVLEHARGDYIAFIDDDEFPVPEWLQRMLKTCEEYQAAGVLGPVRPHFDEPPPRWIIDGRFCERPEHPTGRVMDWEESRTGNVLFQKRILNGAPQAFNPEFGNGGEDKDFFMRMTQQGYVFRWCNEGVTYETVPPSRWERKYMLKRALLRGKNILKHPTGRARLLAISAMAAPVYLVLLPPMLLLGQHRFMKYCIKFCDHLGRLLAFAGINPVSER
jgi:glycosyltransferase involved in cell wall biosynthesis